MKRNEYSIADAVKRVADAITPNINGSQDATGVHVESLTEAVMGFTAATLRVADSISELADAVRGARC